MKHSFITEIPPTSTNREVSERLNIHVQRIKDYYRRELLAESVNRFVITKGGRIFFISTIEEANDGSNSEHILNFLAQLIEIIQDDIPNFCKMLL